MTLNRYLHQPHAENCACSVCWTLAEMAKPVLYQSTPCNDCKPRGLPYLVNGRWYCQTASKCAKHTPSNRPPKYWSVIHDSGKPVPYVPTWGFTNDLLGNGHNVD
ncbi:lysogeny maintenance protein PflM [Pseudomonas sp. S9]|uniref:lysogeny maintenance protein PflM n=1 Tax=Pseudomonas sp. S9 TaxID=686578 RepID=UPI000A00440D|nr:DUF5447 family protein [Pseudomonas sp. S9]